MTFTRGERRRRAATTAGSWRSASAALDRADAARVALLRLRLAHALVGLEADDRRVADDDDGLDRRRQRLPRRLEARDLRVELGAAVGDDDVAGEVRHDEHRVDRRVLGEPLRHLEVPLQALGPPRRRELGRRVHERAARARDRHAAPALALRDDLERRAPVRGMAVADERDRRAGASRPARRTRTGPRTPSNDSGVHGEFCEKIASSGGGTIAVRSLRFTQRRSGSRDAAPKQRRRAAGFVDTAMSSVTSLASGSRSSIVAEEAADLPVIAPGREAQERRRERSR